MLLAHYAHRLPADHDIEALRARARIRGPQWDATPDLGFKAFLLRERGVFGASANDYSSLYLWLSTDAFAAFVGDDRFRVVTDSFGRPAIEIRPVIAVNRGTDATATHLVKQVEAIDIDADLAETIRIERDRAATHATDPHTIAAIAAIDVERWSITRVTLLSGTPEPDESGTTYAILYLAKPGLAGLTQSTGEAA